MLNQSRILNTLSKSLPDDRPITAIQVVESTEKCPAGYFPINKTYDQDQDADLWRDNGFLKKKLRYLCLSKTEGLPQYVVQEIIILNEKLIPPEGYSLLQRTIDSEQKAWRKKQLCYKLVHRKATKQAVTDIIVCGRLKKAPEGFILAGEINGVIVCYKMGNVQDTQSNDSSPGAGGITSPQGRPPDRPPKHAPPPPGQGVYPLLSDGDHDYEILNPGYVPSRPAPPRPTPPGQNNHSHTLSSTTFNGLDGVPFVINPKFLNATKPEVLPVIKAKTMQQLLKDYNYPFTVERQT